MSKYHGACLFGYYLHFLWFPPFISYLYWFISRIRQANPDTSFELTYLVITDTSFRTYYTAAHITFLLHRAFLTASSKVQSKCWLAVFSINFHRSKKRLRIWTWSHVSLWEFIILAPLVEGAIIITHWTGVWWNPVQSRASKFRITRVHPNLSILNMSPTEYLYPDLVTWAANPNFY